MIASNGTPGAIGRCLEALTEQREGVEVVVCEPQASPVDVRDRYPGTRWVEAPDALVPVLWRDGIKASAGAVVALTISPMVPADDWIERLRAALERADVVGGAIEPDAGLSLVDRAEHLCRYSRDMLPFEEHECLDLPGDNAAYPRALLDTVAETWAEGFWEPDVHRALAAGGARLLHDPAVVVRMGRSAGFGPFVRQRWHHGRAHGAQRGALLSRGANVVRVVLAPIVPAVLLLRVARELGRRHRSRLGLLPLMPALACYDIAWAAGEARGHLAAVRER